MVPEVNVTFDDGKSQFTGYKSIFVDPLELDTSLVKIVKSITKDYDQNASYYVRPRQSSNTSLYNQLVAHSSLEHYDEALLQDLHDPWLEKVLSLPPARGFMMRNFLKYLNIGTIQRMEEIAGDSPILRRQL
jgi:hypothetical protein